MDPNTLIVANSDLPTGVVLTGINIVLTSIIGGLVVSVAFLQWRLSKAKFKLDLFEKRYAIYKATQRLLTHILQKANIDLEKLYEFRGDTQDATFLFDNDIPKHLESLDKKATKLYCLKDQLKDMPNRDERKSMAKELSQLLRELTEELPRLKVIFGRYMNFKRWK